MKDQPRMPNGEPYPYVRYTRDENGSLFERLSLQPPPDDLPPGTVEIDEATYLRELQVLEDQIEDFTRAQLATDAERQAIDHAALIKAKIPADTAARMTGHDPEAHSARLAEAAEYVDPKRRTARAV